MKFLFNEKLSLVENSEVLFDGIKLWVKGQGGEKIYLDVAEANETEVSFSNAARDITASLKLNLNKTVAALNIEVDYSPALGDIFGQNHLDTNEAAGIDIAAMPEASAFMANYMRCNFWCGTKIFNDLAEMPVRTQALLSKSENGEYTYLLTACDKYFKTNIKAGENGGCTVFVYSHFPQSKCSECMLIIGRGNDPYTLPTLTAEYGLKVMKKSGKTRKHRRYPEVFEYLGWCSWDAFHMDVTHEDLLKKAEEFKSKEIPVRWMIIDDMWAECHNNNRKTMHSREMYNFEADPERFPNGLAAAVNDLKEDYGMKVGIWYPTTGYMHEVGMDYSKPFPMGDLTFSFDFYALEIGSSLDVVGTMAQPKWAGNAFPGTNGQKWLKIQDKIGEWQTVSFDISTIADGQFPSFHMAAGLKGYFDNFKIIQKNSGIELVDLTFAEGDLGKTSQTISTVVDLPADIAFKTNQNYGVLVDNSANSGTGQLYMHEVGMPYATTYPAGNYTVSFDFYTVSIGSSKIFPMQFTKPGWDGDCMPQKWVELSGNTGVWETVSFDITTTTDGKFPWFYVGAGIKGYLDNFKIVDKSSGTTMLQVPFVKANLGSTSKNINTVVELPETLFENNNETTIEGDTYTISYVVDSEGIKTYGSNGVLYINTDKWMGYTLQKSNIGADILAGKKYRLSFDYDILTPGNNTGEWSIAMVKVKDTGDGNDYVTTATPLSGSKSYEFVADKNNEVYLAVNVGCEVVFDNIVLEEFVNYKALGVQKREDAEGKVSSLAYGFKLHTDMTNEYIYTQDGTAIQVEEKGFIAVLSNHVSGELTVDMENPYVQVVKVTDAADIVIDNGNAHNVYTLAITEPEADRSISVRPYVKGADGNVYYSDVVVGSANDLSNANVWQDNI